MVLQLEPNEYDVLIDVLRRAMGDLREEIYKTDTAEYKAHLKAREAVLAGLLQRLDAHKA